MKDIVDIAIKIANGIVTPLGYLTLGLFLLSLYPPLSFVPKAFLLFVLTH